MLVTYMLKKTARVRSLDDIVISEFPMQVYGPTRGDVVRLDDEYYDVQRTVWNPQEGLLLVYLTSHVDPDETEDIPGVAS